MEGQGKRTSNEYWRRRRGERGQPENDPPLRGDRPLRPAPRRGTTTATMANATSMSSGSSGGRAGSGFRVRKSRHCWCSGAIGTVPAARSSALPKRASETSKAHRRTAGDGEDPERTGPCLPRRRKARLSNPGRSGARRRRALLLLRDRIKLRVAKRARFSGRNPAAWLPPSTDRGDPRRSVGVFSDQS